MTSLSARDALRGVELAELVGVLEGAVLAHRRRPRDVRRAGDVAGALGALLRQRRRREQLAGELRRGADVDERAAPTRRARGRRRGRRGG